MKTCINHCEFPEEGLHDIACNGWVGKTHPPCEFHENQSTAEIVHVITEHLTDHGVVVRQGIDVRNESHNVGWQVGQLE